MGNMGFNISSYISIIKYPLTNKYKGIRYRYAKFKI